MMLLQISEPGKLESVSAIKHVIGVDLGTTHSLVAYVGSDDLVHVLSNLEGENLLPSVVFYDKKETVVGSKALQGIFQNPQNTLSSIKRLIGKSPEEASSLSKLGVSYEISNDPDTGLLAIKTQQGYKMPVEVSAEIIKALVNRAKVTLGVKPEGAVITVPAYFNDGQRQATKDAAKLAGISVLRLINEPTAAALAYGFDASEDGLIAVYDLGGGTFDFSVLEMIDGVFKVLATGGDTALGGNDFDDMISQWLLEQSNMTYSSLSPLERGQLTDTACAAKIKLSAVKSVAISWSHWRGELSRTLFEQLVAPLVDKTIRLMRRAFKDAAVQPSQLNAIIMVGGSSRMPMVRKAVADFSGQEPVTCINPDEVVVYGAARQASVLAGHSDSSGMLLLDVIPLSLGIETMGGLTEKVIARNTTIPIAKAQEFTTYQDGQTAIQIHVLQGERELVQDNRSLASFTLKGIPPMSAGIARVRVTFQIDADGLLSVTAEETSTNVKTTVEIKPFYGLSEEQIAAMLKASFDNASEDIQDRSLREKFVNAEQLLMSLNKAMEMDAHLLTKEENQLFKTWAAELRQAIDDKILKKIEKTINALNEASKPFAVRCMNSEVRKMLSGHAVDEFLEQQIHDKKS